MNNETNKVYSLLQDIFKNIWEQQKYSELKNGVLLTLNIAIFVVLIRVYFPLVSQINSNFIIKISFYTLMILFIIHILLIIQSYFPNDKKEEKIKWTADKINIFFFGDILKLNNEKYLDIVVEKSKIDKSKIDSSLLYDLSNQIVKLSEITQYKYNSFKSSIYRMYTLGFFFIVYFSILYFR